MLTTSILDFPEDVLDLKNATADFINRRVLPHEAEISASGELPPALQQELKESGYFGLTIPTEYGGAGLSHLAFYAVHEELTRAPKPLWLQLNNANGIAARFLEFGNSEELRQKYLPGIATGNVLPAIAVTEPEAGSDVQGLKARAVQTPSGWRINGTKHYITFGGRADILFLLARTAGRDAGSKAFTLFLVEKGTPGLKVARLQETMGGRPLEQAELTLDELELPDTAVIGEVGGGLKLVFKTFAEERLTMATTALGTAQRAIELGVEYAKTRKAFGSSISEYQAIQHSLADSATELFAARSMTFALARQLGDRAVAPYEAAMVKLYASEMAGRVVDRVLQIFGGAGYMAETPICQMYRDVRVLRLAGGTSEIQRNMIARHLLGQ